MLLAFFNVVWMQVDVPLTITLTVPDQATADTIHSSVAQPAFPSPGAPFLDATRADAAALALTSLIQADTFFNLGLPSLGAVLEQSPMQYPSVSDAQVPSGSQSPLGVCMPRRALPWMPWECH